MKETLKWGSGFIFIIGGIGFIVNGFNIISAIILIIGGLICIPPILSWIEVKINIVLTTKMKYFLVIGCFLISGIITNLNSKNAKVDKPKIQNDFKIDINAENISDRDIKVRIKTNFPENTPLTITASRDYYRKNNPDKYSIDIFYSFNSFVKNGEINFAFKVDDKKWLDEYKALQKQQGEYDKSLTDIDLKTIKDTLEIQALYTPKAEQTKEIKDIIGENGENLRGNGVKKHKDYFIYIKTIKLFNKFKL